MTTKQTKEQGWLRLRHEKKKIVKYILLVLQSLPLHICGIHLQSKSNEEKINNIMHYYFADAVNEALLSTVNNLQLSYKTHSFITVLLYWHWPTSKETTYTNYVSLYMNQVAHQARAYHDGFS